MKRTGFTSTPDRPHYWLSDARAPACLVDADTSAAPDAEGLVRLDIELRDGRIAALAPIGTAPAEATSLHGGLVWPGFADIHTHLDKGHIWPRTPNPDGSFFGALTATSVDRKAHWTAADVRARMEFGLQCAWAQGTVAVRLIHAACLEVHDTETAKSQVKLVSTLREPPRQGSTCS